MKKIKLIILSLLSIFLLNSCITATLALMGMAMCQEYGWDCFKHKSSHPNKSPYRIYNMEDEKIKKYLTEVSNRKKEEIKYKNKIIKIPNNFELLEINSKYFSSDDFYITSRDIEYLGGKIEQSQYFYDSEKKIGMPVHIFESKYKNIEELFEKVSQSDKNMLKKENEKIKFCYKGLYKESEFDCNFYNVKNVGDNIFIYYNSGVLGEDFIGEVIE